MKKTITALSVAAIAVSLPVFAATTHKVKEGDTMWKLSLEYGSPLYSIVEANPQIKNPDVLYPGQLVTIPVEVSASSTEEKEVVRLVNEIRVRSGLGALAHDPALGRVALRKSRDMADNGYFSHTSPTYGSPFDMLNRFGIVYRTAGENIAKGQRTAGMVVEDWMNSPGHRANIMSPSYNKIGVGYVPEGRIWTQLFTD